MKSRCLLKRHMFAVLKTSFRFDSAYEYFDSTIYFFPDL